MDSNTKIYDLIVIGGGASGMMAAVTASENGAKVLILEKNKRLGEKLRITGGGRCNITNTEENLRVYLKNYGKAEQFLYSAFTEFNAFDTINYFNDLKLPTKVEAKNRAFPQSELAADVVHVLINKLHRNGVEMITGANVTKILKQNNTIEHVECGTTKYRAINYILATGGKSRPETGSTGDGFVWLEQLGHEVNNPTPNITPIALKDRWVSKVSGVTAKNATITFFVNNSAKFKLKGDILFTHFGISGPLILNNAYRVADLLTTGEVTAKIDLLPDVDQKTLDLNIITELNNQGIKQLKNVISSFTPFGLTPIIKELLKNEVNIDMKASEVNRQNRKLILESIKSVNITIDKLMGFEKAVVANGGLSLKDIDTRTMRSNIISNLFITGDLLDINRPSGGFSLQLCWTTGYIAGRNSVAIK